MIDILDWFELEEQEINCIRCNKHIYIAKQLYDVTKNYVCNQCWLSQEEYMSKFFMQDDDAISIEVYCNTCGKIIKIPENLYNYQVKYTCDHCLKEQERLAKVNKYVDDVFKKGKK